MRFPITLIIGLLITANAASAQDSTTAPASLRYADPNLPQRIFIGGNYRETWAMPVRVKVFHVDKEKGGLIVKKLGGGMQTKSLRLEDKNGQKYVLRTIDKTVDKAMEAEGIKSGFIKSVTQDMISAAQPYGALTVPPMAKALGLATSDPELVFVPDDPKLGEYRSVFANTMCLFELREPSLHPDDKVVSTEDMLKDMKQHKDWPLDAKMLLQARLLDMLISDWDRHGGQWKWGYRKAGGSTKIYPIPVDHDQAFFHSSGILVPMVRPFTMKHIIGFREESRKLKALNRKEWDFDKKLLAGLTEADWRAGIQTFQSKLTDAVLLAAAQRLPKEVYNSYGQDLYEQLKSRRNTMDENAMKYFRFLQDYEAKPLREEQTAEKGKDE